MLNYFTSISASKTKRLRCFLTTSLAITTSALTHQFSSLSFPNDTHQLDAEIYIYSPEFPKHIHICMYVTSHVGS